MVSQKPRRMGRVDRQRKWIVGLVQRGGWMDEKGKEKDEVGWDGE